MSTQSQEHEKQARPKTDALTEIVIEVYTKADDFNTRTQILSLIANKYTKSELLSLNDGLLLSIKLTRQESMHLLMDQTNTLHHQK